MRLNIATYIESNNSAIAWTKSFFNTSKQNKILSLQKLNQVLNHYVYYVVYIEYRVARSSNTLR